MIKIEQKKINDKKLSAKMLLQIHDELIFETKLDNKNYSMSNIAKIMESVSSSEYHKFSIPLKVNVNSGYNWGETN